MEGFFLEAFFLGGGLFSRGFFLEGFYTFFLSYIQTLYNVYVDGYLDKNVWLTFEFLGMFSTEMWQTQTDNTKLYGNLTHEQFNFINESADIF